MEKETGYFWDGKIKELRIFNKELDNITINNWMNIRVNGTHPDYSNLVAHYPLNEGIGSSANDNSPNNQVAIFNGNVLWESTRGEHISQFLGPTNFRPHINIFQGDYSTTTTTITVLDSLLAAPNTVEEKSIYSNHNTLLHDSIAIISSNTYWHAVSYTYDANGSIISSDTTTVDGTINVGELTYITDIQWHFRLCHLSLHMEPI